MSRKTIITARIIMLLYIAAVAYLCFWNFNSLPEVSRTILGFPPDKVVHFTMFLPFPILSYFCTGKTFSAPWKAVVFVAGIFLGGCIIAAGTEIGQSMIPYRVCDPMDFKADTLALIISSFITFFIILIQNFRKRK